MERAKIRFEGTRCTDRLASQWRGLEVSGHVRFHPGGALPGHHVRTGFLDHGGDSLGGDELRDLGGVLVLGRTVCMWVGFLIRILVAAVV